MCAYSRPLAITLPDLPSEWVQLWVEKTQDLVLVLDAGDRVLGVFQNGDYWPDDVNHWIGQRLQAIVSSDTLPKIELLLANDAARPGTDARWRHINLVGAHGQSLPILARFMVTPTPAGLTRTIFCRDLRPVQEQTQRFMKAHEELAQTMQTRTASVAHQPLNDAALSVDAQALIPDIQRKNLDQVVGETARSIERMCLQSLLAQAGGDHAQAAKWAGISLTDWQLRLADFQINT